MFTVLLLNVTKWLSITVLKMFRYVKRLCCHMQARSHQQQDSDEEDCVAPRFAQTRMLLGADSDGFKKQSHRLAEGVTKTTLFKSGQGQEQQQLSKNSLIKKPPPAQCNKEKLSSLSSSITAAEKAGEAKTTASDSNELANLAESWKKTFSPSPECLKDETKKSPDSKNTTTRETATLARNEPKDQATQLSHDTTTKAPPPPYCPPAPTNTAVFEKDSHCQKPSPAKRKDVTPTISSLPGPLDHPFPDHPLSPPPPPPQTATTETKGETNGPKINHSPPPAIPPTQHLLTGKDDAAVRRGKQTLDSGGTDPSTTMTHTPDAATSNNKKRKAFYDAPPDEVA